MSTDNRVKIGLDVAWSGGHDSRYTHPALKFGLGGNAGATPCRAADAIRQYTAEQFQRRKISIVLGERVLGLHRHGRHPQSVHERPRVPAVVRGRAELEGALDPDRLAQAVEAVATVRHDVDRRAREVLLELERLVYHCNGTTRGGSPSPVRTGRANNINHFNHTFTVTTAADETSHYTFGKDGTTIT